MFQTHNIVLLSASNAVAKRRVLLRGSTTGIAIRVRTRDRQRAPDAPFDANVRIERLIGRHSLRVLSGDTLITHHAGTGARFEPDFGFCFRRELLAGFHHQRSVEITGLPACGDVQFPIGIEIRLKCLRPHLGGDFNGLKISGFVLPFFGPGVETHLRGME